MTHNRKAKALKITMFNKCILKHPIFRFQGHLRSPTAEISEKMSNLKFNSNYMSNWSSWRIISKIKFESHSRSLKVGISGKNKTREVFIFRFFN